MNSLPCQSDINKAFEMSARLRSIKVLIRVADTADALIKGRAYLSHLIEAAKTENDKPIIDVASILMAETQNRLKALASDPHISEETQKTLSTYEDNSVRELLASNPHISEETQKTLSTDEAWVIRWTLACNPNITEVTKGTLSRDEEWFIRMALEERPEVPKRRQ